MVNAVVYAAVAFLAARNPHAPAVDFSSLEGIRTMFADADACFAGWLHYCVFDPLIGFGEVLDSRQLKVPHLLVVPCLLMTMLAVYRTVDQRRFSFQRAMTAGTGAGTLALDVRKHISSIVCV